MPATKCAKPARDGPQHPPRLLDPEPPRSQPVTKTIRIYRDAADDLLRHLAATDGPSAPEEFARAHLEGLLADMIARGLSPSTVSLTYRALQQWTKWLVDEEEISTQTIASRCPGTPQPTRW